MSASLGRTLGLSFGDYLGRQLALGACRDDPDDDWERRTFTPRVAPSALPASVDLRAWMTPVEDQGQLGSCTANALAGALEYLVRRETGEHVDVSRLFIYFNQRLWDDAVREDIGAAISHGVRVLAKVGAPLEPLWPYDKRLFAVQPPERVYAEAARFRLKDWWSVPIAEGALEACLAGGFPIVFGTRVTESFMRVGRDGLVPNIGAGDRDDAKHGRHALLLTGYDRARRRFVVRNSWGTSWGDGGYGYMPYDYILNRTWTRNAWALRLTDRTAFDTTQRLDARPLPSAPPSQRGGGTGVGAAAQIAGVGAEMAVGMLTGSGLLGGLLGGLVTGIAPGVVQRVSGRDGGTPVETDRSGVILEALRGHGAPPPGLAPAPWDDGLDEDAARGVGSTREALAKAAPIAGVPRVGTPSTGASSTGTLATGTRTTDTLAKGTPSIGTLATGALATGSLATGMIAGSAPTGVTSGVSSAPTAPAREVPRPTDALVDAIDALWRELGGEKGPYGAPVGGATEMLEGAHRGVSVRFAGGGMFAWPGAPVLALRTTDRLLMSWIERGGPRSPLGWPSGAAVSGADGRARILPLTRGALFEVPGRPVTGLWGSLFAYWLQLGGPAAPVGTLSADLHVETTPEGPEEVARFAHATLRWSPVHGVRRD